MRVVVVEDEALIAMALQASLAAMGYEVCAVAHSAAEANEAVAAHRPDLLTCDVDLGPGGSGVEVAAKAYEEWGIRTLFISGNIDAALIQSTRPIRPLGYLAKPFPAPRLIAALRPAA